MESLFDSCICVGKSFFNLGKFSSMGVVMFVVEVKGCIYGWDNVWG